MNRLLVILALAACGGGSASKPAPTKTEPAQPAPPVAESKELTGKIEKIRVTGAATLQPQVEAAVTGLANKPLDRETLRVALANVMLISGVADITVKGVQLATGIELVVEVTPHPIMRKLTATEGTNTIALGMAAMPANTPLDPAKLQALAASLRDRYISQGYFNADATWRKTPVTDGVEVVIEVKPGDKSEIAAVKFTGNKLAAKDLLAQTAKLLVVGEPAQADKIEAAGLAISAYYWDRGYANVSVRSPKITAGKQTLTFEIQEGPVFKVGKIEITGDLPQTEHAKYLKLFAVKQGAVFNRTAIVKGRQAMVDALVATGKPTADVTPLTNVDLPKKTIGLTLEVSAR